MKSVYIFTVLFAVYIWHFLIGVVISMPNPDEHIRDGVLTPSKKNNKTFPPIPSKTFVRLDQLSEEEREERINRGMARMMQFIAYKDHVDNYLTDKAETLTRILNQAMVTDDEEELQEEYYDRRRQARPRISTTITS